MAEQKLQPAAGTSTDVAAAVPTEEEDQVVLCIDRLVDDDYLRPHKPSLVNRMRRYLYLKNKIAEVEGGLAEFATGFRRFGLHVCDEGIRYCEWAPGALSLSLVGDFNGWKIEPQQCSRDSFGNWTVLLHRHPDGSLPISHNSRIKVSVETRIGCREYRIPSWISYVKQNKMTNVYDGIFWNPPESYQWKHASPPKVKRPKIYECHVGMSGEEPRCATYEEFARDRLPYIKDMGYNVVQFMAIMEHAYYGSFGYQVTSFFAVSSWSGDPDGFKYLVDECHRHGLSVFLDIIHSHASKNSMDGLSHFDGTDGHYFHEGGRGQHMMWDSRLFDYGKWETLRFLLSNLRWWVEEYHVDGFRFDGVTSMIYHHHGLGNQNFDYDHYFGGAVETDALCYLTLANDMVHSLNPNIVTVAEEVSGLPYLCRRFDEGGIGFDYRLHMGCPDLWVDLLKKVKDEDWSVQHIAFVLQNRRYLEPCIAYAESHDQALVGDKTIAFWLMDKDMYDSMSTFSAENVVITRGIAMHKLIRYITFAMGGEGYLTFMGNEFGHPEWIDFPREGNNQNFHYARRQWHLAFDPLLRYQHMLAFEKRMLWLEDEYPFLDKPPAYVTKTHESDKIVAFERGDLLSIVNFHTYNSYTDYAIPTHHSGRMQLVLDSDRAEFGGQNRIQLPDPVFTHSHDENNLHQCLKVYIPCRVALVFVKLFH